jgi:hypothetical protein
LASAVWQAAARLDGAARVESETQPDFICPNLLPLPGINMINQASLGDNEGLKV